jgi:glycosyltransferase involved in cell wall biosynthesis
MTARPPVISMVIPFYNEADNVDILYDRLATVLDATHCA